MHTSHAFGVQVLALAVAGQPSVNRGDAEAAACVGSANVHPNHVAAVDAAV